MKTNKFLLLANLLLAVLACHKAQAFYNPQTGRWLTRDPIEETGGKNLHAFVANEPLQKLDADGRLWWPFGSRTCCCRGWTVKDVEVDTLVVRMKWTEANGPNYHVWLEWRGLLSVDSNAGSYLNINPMIGRRPAGGKIMPQYSTPAPTGTPIKLSPCKYDIQYFKDCLTTETEQYTGEGKYTGQFCDEFVDQLIARCKKRSEGCTPMTP